MLRVRYPDGAHDAEALLVTPTGEIVIVTKGETGPVGLYRVPSDAKPGGTATLQPIGRPHQRKPAEDERITDGAVSPSGAWVALTTNTRHPSVSHRGLDVRNLENGEPRLAEGVR